MGAPSFGYIVPSVTASLLGAPMTMSAGGMLVGIVVLLIAWCNRRIREYRSP